MIKCYGLGRPDAVELSPRRAVMGVLVRTGYRRKWDGGVNPTCTYTVPANPDLNPPITRLVA